MLGVIDGLALVVELGLLSNSRTDLFKTNGENVIFGLAPTIADLSDSFIYLENLTNINDQNLE